MVSLLVPSAPTWNVIDDVEFKSEMPLNVVTFAMRVISEEKLLTYLGRCLTLSAEVLPMLSETGTEVVQARCDCGESGHLVQSGRHQGQQNSSVTLRDCHFV